MSRSPSWLPAYRALLGEADAWFSGAVAACVGEVLCRPGCDGCCRGLFDITPADAALVAEGVRAAAPEVRAAMRAAAERTLAGVREAAPEWGPPFRIGAIGSDRFDALCDTLSEVPCPALGADGACRIYAHRPLICRLHGLPMWDPGERACRGGACPLNAVPEEVAEERPALHFDYRRFEEEELALLEACAGPGAALDPDGAGTIVAAAVLAADDGERSPWVQSPE